MDIKIDSFCRLASCDDNAVDVLRLELDDTGVSKAVVHPPDDAYAWYNEQWNDFIMSCASKNNWLIPAITVNPWRRDSKDVLLKYLEQGAKIISFSPSSQGFILSDDILPSILNAIPQKKKPLIYIRTGDYSHSTPAQLALLANRFRYLTFIMGHSGATDFGSDVAPVCNSCPNIFVESSFARPAKFTNNLKRLGFDRGIMGSGYPSNSMEFEWSEMIRLLPEQYQQQVLGSNLFELLEKV